MPLQPIITTWFALNGANDETASGIADIRTGAPLFVGGLNIGDYFDMTEQEANEHTWTGPEIEGKPKPPGPTLHSGRYRRVQIHKDATETNVIVGKVGFMVTALIPDVNIVTSADKGLVGVRPVIFLNSVEPGNFCWIQELGVATVRMGSGGGAIGAMISVSSSGTGSVATESSEGNVIGKALDVPASNQLIRVLLDLPVVQG